MKVIVNPDEELVKSIREKLKENNGHCCCSFIQKEENLCPCEEFRDQVKRGEFGECSCGLYLVVEEDQ